MAIYADVVFFLNVVMDFFLFWIAGKLTGTKIPYFRMLMGSMMASFLYCCMLFIPWLEGGLSFFGGFFILLFCIWFIFRPKGSGEWILLLVFTYLSAFAIGGVGIALFYFTSMPDWIGQTISFSVGNFPVKILVISCSIFYVILKLGSGWIDTRMTKSQNFCRVRIEQDGQSAEAVVLIDTGHALYDPVSKEPVLILEFSKIRHFFPLEAQILFYEKKTVTIDSLFYVLGNHPLRNRLREIPFSSLGTEAGVLPAFVADKAEILVQGKEAFPLKMAIIGIVNRPLGNGKGYYGLVNEGIFSSSAEFQ